MVGTGIAAHALAPALIQANCDLRYVSGRNLKMAADIARPLGARSGDIQDAELDVDLVVLAVSDHALPTVSKMLLTRDRPTGVIFAHMAGALRPAVLAGNGRKGKMHPIASLAGGPNRLRGVAWGIEGDMDVAEELRGLAERMGGLPIDTSMTDLSLYHLAAVFGSNFLLGVLAEATELWSESGAPLPAPEALIPLARTVLDNWEQLGLEASLTGPIARGDTTAVAAQLRTAGLRGAGFEALYRSLALAAASVAMGSAPNNPAIAEITRLIAESQVLD